MESACCLESVFVGGNETKQVISKRKLKKNENNLEFISSLKRSFEVLGVDFCVEGIEEEGGVGYRGVDVILNGGERKLKILLNHGRNGSIGIRDDLDLKGYWMVVVGSVTERNNLGYVLKGCEGEETEQYIETTGGKGWTRRLVFDRMRGVTLERRLRMVS